MPDRIPLVGNMPAALIEGESTMARMTKKKYAVVGGVAAVALTAGAAFAYWTSAGTGTGSATTGTDTAWDVQVDDTDLAVLTPDGPTETVAFTVQNDSDGVQSFSAAVPTVTGTDDAGCTAADFLVDNVVITTGSVAAGATVNGVFDIQMIDTGVNQDDCKDVTVNLEVAVS